MIMRHLIYYISSVIRQSFFFQNNPKKLDLSCKTDLAVCGSLGWVKTDLALCGSLGWVKLVS